jgi:hypothetical protein
LISKKKIFSVKREITSLNIDTFYIYSKCSYLWIELQTNMPLKPLSQINWNLVGSIYGRSSIKIAHFVPNLN